MAELRKVTRRAVQSDFRRVTPTAGGAFAALGDMANAAYSFLEPLAIDEQRRKGAEAGRQDAQAQEGPRTQGQPQPRPQQDGGLGTVGETPARGVNTPQVTTTNLDGSKEDFIGALMPAAQAAAEQTGIDPRIIVAQAALESGWGKSAPGNNFFGIKSHGQSGGQNLNTTEVINGETVQINDSFRQYGSADESVQGYAEFMMENPRYRDMMAAEGLEAQVAALGASGYATDPDYAAKILQIASSLPSNEPISVGEDGTLTGGDTDRVDVSSIIGDQEPDIQMSTRSAPPAQDAPRPPEPETTVRTKDGRIEPRLFSPASGPILQSYNAAYGVAYVSDKTVRGLEDMMAMSTDHRGNPTAFQQSSAEYIDQAVADAPQQFQEDIRASLTTESQRRYLGMLDEQQRETDQRASNSSRALMDRYSSDYAEALASGLSEDASVARQQLESVLYARESLPGVAWTREQSENLIMKAMDQADTLRRSAASAMSDEWKKQFNTAIAAANDGRASDFDALVNNPAAVEAHPELAREAMAMMTVRDGMPQFMGAPPAVQQEIIRNERDRSIGAVWETDILGAMETANAASVKALEDDPIQYGMERIQGAPPALDLSTATDDPEGFANAMAARSEFGNSMQEEGYIDYPAFLTDDEVQSFSAVLGKDSPPEVRAALATAIVSGFGADAATVFGELNADPVTMFGGQLMSAGGPAAQATFMQALQGQELLDANQIQLPSGSSRISSFAPNAAVAMQGLPNIGVAQEQVMKFAQALYASSAEGLDPTSEDAKLLMEQATQRALGQATKRNGTVTGGVQTVTGHPVLLPIGVSGEELNNAVLASFSAEKTPDGFMERMTAGMMASATLPTGQLDPTVWQNASNSGAVPMYGTEPMPRSIFTDERVRFVATGGNTYRMEVITGNSVHDITTENGSVFMFDISKLTGASP